MLVKFSGDTPQRNSLNSLSSQDGTPAGRHKRQSYFFGPGSGTFPATEPQQASTAMSQLDLALLGSGLPSSSAAPKQESSSPRVTERKPSPRTAPTKSRESNAFLNGVDLSTLKEQPAKGSKAYQLLGITESDNSNKASEEALKQAKIAKELDAIAEEVEKAKHRRNPFHLLKK